MGKHPVGELIFPRFYLGIRPPIPDQEIKKSLTADDAFRGKKMSDLMQTYTRGYSNYLNTLYLRGGKNGK
jgi:hypothetical protein